MSMTVASPVGLPETRRSTSRVHHPRRADTESHVVCVLHVYVQEVAVMAVPESTTQNITVRLDRRTLRRAKVLAAQRNTSISGLLAQQIESQVGENDAYEQAQHRALDLLDRGLHLGGRIKATRDE